VENRQLRENPAAVKRITEVAEWFRSFLIGSDDSPRYQYTSLSLLDAPYPPTIRSSEDVLSPADGELIRKHVRDDFVPGFNHFLMNFAPLSEYIIGSRAIELEVNAEEGDGEDIRKHAFNRLRFNTPTNNDLTINRLVDQAFEDIRNKYIDLKQTLPQHILLDIGMRGIMFALAELKRIIDATRQVQTWSEYTRLITPFFNTIYGEGWLDEFEEASILVKKYMTYILYDEVGSVRQYYKPEHMHKHLGGLLTILLLPKLHAAQHLTIEVLEEVVQEHAEHIEQSYLKGFKNEYRRQHRNTLLAPELRRRALEHGRRRARERIVNLYEYLELEFRND